MDDRDDPPVPTDIRRAFASRRISGARHSGYPGFGVGGGEVAPANALLTEASEPLLTEAGDFLETET